MSRYILQRKAADGRAKDRYAVFNGVGNMVEVKYARDLKDIAETYGYTYGKRKAQETWDDLVSEGFERIY